MYRPILTLILACLLLPARVEAAESPAAKGLRDVYFGEALYHAYQGEWFDSIARLDTELNQHRRLDEPALDSLYPHLGEAEFDVGDFELGYRMHLRAGRAISAVIEGKVAEPVRNQAIYRLARLYFRKDQPEDALGALERIKGEVPEQLGQDADFLRAQILLEKGRPEEASPLLKELRGAKGLEGFAGYNLGIALMQQGKEEEGRQHLDRTGQLKGEDASLQAIRDKSNLVLGYQLLDKNAAGAKLALDRVRLSGPFSNRALLGSGWADAALGAYEKALVPWSILAGREATDPAVQEALLAVPYAYGKLNAYGKAALLYGQALDSFGKEIDKLALSVASVEEGRFLAALAREELKQDADWAVKLRNLPKAPETYYLLELMASHDFQESLKNYLDLMELDRKLASWDRDLDAFEEMIEKRRNYYQPLLPQVDQAFGQLDSQIRLRMEQRQRVDRRLKALLTAPNPDHLATAEERVAREKIARLEQALTAGGAQAPADAKERIARLKGVIAWDIATGYHQRLTDAWQHLEDLNLEVEAMQKRYAAFVRTRQAATQSYEGYDGTIKSQRARIAKAKEEVAAILPRQGSVVEAMAVNELKRRLARLEQLQVTARFAIADSYDRANKAQAQKRVGE